MPEKKYHQEYTMNPSNSNQSIPIENTLPVPQCVQILYQAVLIAQKSGVYSFQDAAAINMALESLKTRLGLDDKFAVKNN